MTTWTPQTKNTTSWTNQDKTDFVPAGKFDVGLFDKSRFDASVSSNSTVWTNQSKNTT